MTCTGHLVLQDTLQSFSNRFNGCRLPSKTSKVEKRLKRRRLLQVVSSEESTRVVPVPCHRWAPEGLGTITLNMADKRARKLRSFRGCVLGCWSICKLRIAMLNAYTWQRTLSSGHVCITIGRLAILCVKMWSSKGEDGASNKSYKTCSCKKRCFSSTEINLSFSQDISINGRNSGISHAIKNRCKRTKSNTFPGSSTSNGQEWTVEVNSSGGI